jgi:hypothetical protein
MEGLPSVAPGLRGLSVPEFVFRHAPSLSTPESRTAAHTRCFTVRAGLALSEGLATLTGVTRLLWVRLRYGSRLRLLRLRVPDHSDATLSRLHG